MESKHSSCEKSVWQQKKHSDAFLLIDKCKSFYRTDFHQSASLKYGDSAPLIWNCDLSRSILLSIFVCLFSQWPTDRSQWLAMVNVWHSRSICCVLIVTECAAMWRHICLLILVCNLLFHFQVDFQSHNSMRLKQCGVGWFVLFFFIPFEFLVSVFFLSIARHFVARFSIWNIDNRHTRTHTNKRYNQQKVVVNTHKCSALKFPHKNIKANEMDWFGRFVDNGLNTLLVYPNKKIFR